VTKIAGTDRVSLTLPPQDFSESKDADRATSTNDKGKGPLERPTRCDALTMVGLYENLGALDGCALSARMPGRRV
jgi:hypothetical protein